MRRTVEIHFRNNGVLLAGILDVSVRPAVDGVVLAELICDAVVEPLVVRVAGLVEGQFEAIEDLVRV